MISYYAASDRGIGRLDWLDTRYSFSFADWHDSSRMGFRSLRVLNDDRVAPGAGFDLHSHRDMEILTVVLEGSLKHEDSSGAHTILHAGDVQCMSAGRGIAHSEWNASNDESLHLLQIWILPAERRTPPSHAEALGLFPVGADAPAGQRILTSASGAAGALSIGQDAVIRAGRATGSEPFEYEIARGRGVFVHAVRGPLVVNGTALGEGDGLAIEDESRVTLAADASADFLLFDLA
jgi:redox-sensitive bicupin YhaK (pirin superfamily)